tara:strand:+ start:1400 stop:3256 length:1857 start_codon:yes stop_codon:yes gene_type:complete
MANHKLNISDLDFDQIKTNLKTFLQSQAEFQDYNFEGSGLSILIDVLSYNTHYLAYLANMSTNEIYLDSADIRNNIVSLAKMVGYTPTSVRAPRADIDIVVNNASGTSLTMNKGTIFSTTVDDVQYQYVTNGDITITPSSGVYRFSNVTLYEGTLVTFKYTVDVNDPDQKFIIPSDRADTSTLKVSVQNSATDTTLSTYTFATTLANVSSSSKTFFLQETDDGRFQVYFGDGVTGAKLDDGNIVILEYVVTNTTESNGASSFSLSGNIGGFTDVTLTTNSNSQGGAEAETNESIKFNAPLSYATQNRAVTTTDYETFVKQLYPNAISVSAWGGEDDETPVYGVVKISIKAGSGSTLTQATKNDIIAQLKKYNVASVRPEIVDAETTSVILNSNIRYDSKKTVKTADTLKSNVVTAITNYNSSTLQKFDGVFRYSKVVGIIDNVDDSVVSNITTIKIRKPFTPTLNTSARYDVYFRNAFYNPHSGHNSDMGGILASTGFKVSGNTNEMFLDDDGAGNVRRYFLDDSGIKTYANNTQGTINYATGQISLNSLNVTSISNIRGSSSTVIELTVIPNSNDIIPVRNTVVEIDVSNSSFLVEQDNFVGGGNDAGVGYTTATSY